MAALSTEERSSQQHDAAERADGMCNALWLMGARRPTLLAPHRLNLGSRLRLDRKISARFLLGFPNRRASSCADSSSPRTSSFFGSPEERPNGAESSRRAGRVALRAAGGGGGAGGRGRPGGGGAGDELGHAGHARALAQDRRADAQGQRRQEGQALRRRPGHAQRARRHRHRGHGRHPQRPARPHDRLRHRTRLGQAQRLAIPLRRRRQDQVCRCRQRALLGVLQRHLRQGHVPGAAEHPERAQRRRPQRRQGHRAAQRRRVQLPDGQPGAVRGPLPHRHHRPHDGHGAVPGKQQRALHRQHLPLPQPLPQRRLPRRLCLLRGQRRAGARRRRLLHQRVRRQLRHARLRAQGRRPRRPAHRHRGGRLAHRRRQARHRRPRAALLQRPAHAPRRQQGHAAPAQPVHGGLPVRPPGRGRQERRARRVRAALGHPPLRRPAQVPHRPHRTGAEHHAGAGQGRGVPAQDVVRLQQQRQGHQQARRERQLRLHLRRLHRAGIRLHLRRHGRHRQRLLRIQRLLPGAEPEGRGLRLPGARRAHADRPLHRHLQLHHTDRRRILDVGRPPADESRPDRRRCSARAGSGPVLRVALGATCASELQRILICDT